MKIGFDLDNTIANYDEIFFSLGKDLKNVPDKFLRSKIKLAEYLRKNGREGEWTKLQGKAYGPKMKEAKVAPYFQEVLGTLIEKGNTCYVVSHRTKFPASGESYDLHSAADEWLKQNFQDLFSKIYFEETLAKKIKRINMLNVDIFVDDLERVLSGIKTQNCKLFQYAQHTEDSSWEQLSDWRDLLPVTSQ
jgi:hypothetical protein